MKVANAVLAYNPHSGEIQIGLVTDPPGWTDEFEIVSNDYRVPAAVLSPDRLIAEVFIAFVTAVLVDGVELAAATRAFTQLDEFRENLPEALQPVVNGTRLTH